MSSFDDSKIAFYKNCLPPQNDQRKNYIQTFYGGGEEQTLRKCHKELKIAISSDF